MTFLVISFLAGILTVLAPCILPLLTVIIGTSASSHRRSTPFTVVISLCLSIILFTFLLKVSTAFITIPQSFWTFISGLILVLFGLVLIFPGIWEKIPLIGKLSTKSNQTLGKGFKKKSFWGDVIIGASLGPIFSTCSPTYFVILASVLPASFLLGTVYLISYTAGLGLTLFSIAVLGQKFTNRLNKLADPKSKFKKITGIVFLILGIMIIFGLEKKLETKILDSGYFDITKIEQKLLDKN